MQKKFDFQFLFWLVNIPYCKPDSQTLQAEIALYGVKIILKKNVFSQI